VTTYGDSTTATATNTATSNAVTWAADHVTKTTTYTFADSTTNPVVTTVAGTTSTPTLTPVVYPADWLTVGALGAVTKPTVSSKITSYGDGYSITLEDGTLAKPFLQATLLGLSIADPNAVTDSSTTSYDLRWGTPDKSGPSYASSFSPSRVTFLSPLAYMGIPVSSYTNTLSGPTLNSPSLEVRTAWGDGWTGKGVNILLVDGYTGTGTAYEHGVTTMMITDLIAIGATKFGVDSAWDSVTLLPTGVVKAGSSGAAIATLTNMGVVNASFGFNYWANTLDPNLAADVTAAFGLVALAGGATTWQHIFNGASFYPLANVADAVIVKSAGNDTTSAANEPFVFAYANDIVINPRLLVVGATLADGTALAKTSIAAYSNTAGTNATIANRFLVANGVSPYSTGDVGINGFTVAAGAGTSYAAPRVAGYVAILRQKFSNLDAVHSASILLDTARYDTLSCHPNCDPTIYGKGEASLSRALAPVGYLR
jgi:hypothetical protein